MVGAVSQNCTREHCKKNPVDSCVGSAWAHVLALFSYWNECGLSSSSIKAMQKIGLYLAECWDIQILKGSGWISWQQSGEWIRWSGWISSQTPLQICLVLLTGGVPVNVICICWVNERKLSFTTWATNFKEQVRGCWWIIMSFLECFL